MQSLEAPVTPPLCRSSRRPLFALPASLSSRAYAHHCFSRLRPVRAADERICVQEALSAG